MVAGPDSALPPTIQTIAGLIDTAVAQAESKGVGMVQMKRISGHLAKQAYRLLKDDGLHRFVRTDELLDEAFLQLTVKLDLKADQRAPLEEEFEHVRGYLGRFPLAKTEVFFDRPQEAADFEESPRDQRFEQNAGRR